MLSKVQKIYTFLSLGVKPSFYLKEKLIYNAYFLIPRQPLTCRVYEFASNKLTLPSVCVFQI